MLDGETGICACPWCVGILEAPYCVQAHGRDRGLSKKPETKFKERIFPLLAVLPNSWWEKIQQRTIRGTPDILGAIGGILIALELKADGDEVPDALQLHKLDMIRQAGGFAWVVHPDNWDEVYADLCALAQTHIPRPRIRQH